MEVEIPTVEVEVIEIVMMMMMTEGIKTEVVEITMSPLLLFLLRLTIAVLGWNLRNSTSKVVMNFAEAPSMRMEEVNLSLHTSGTSGTLITDQFAVLMKLLLLPVTVTIEITPMAQLLKQSKRWPSQSKPSSMVTLELGTLPQQMVSLL